LAAEGIEISLFSIPLIKPLKFDQRFFDKYNHLFVVEEHSKINGLGTALSDYIHEQQLDLRLVKLALPDEIQIGIGSQDYLRRISNLDSKSIVRSVKNELGR
jgi:transketolase C-terminal domain/subunit